jgi:two-component system, LytTR family, sensor kinase
MSSKRSLVSDNENTTTDEFEPRTGAPESAKRTILMHPAFFITASTMVGLLFALQEWGHLNMEGYQIDPEIVFTSWGLQYFLWGVIGWVLWRLFRPFIQSASIAQMFMIVLPVSFATYLIETMIWVVLVPHYPTNHPNASYWHHVVVNYRGDMAESLTIFWCAFFFFRGMGYYQQFREKETAAVHLEAQLANAKMAALRMQLNPHFLFNTMNSISSLMRSDVDAADAMLEHLSSLLRMTLERGDVQLIPLRDEIDFTETYLAMQDQRYAGRVTRMVSVDAELHDALVPAMILQPIVENAYAHGLSKLDRGGQLYIDVRKDGEQLKALITNNGIGLMPGMHKKANGAGVGGPGAGGYGVGLANVKDRLRLHYGSEGEFTMCELDLNRVQVSISFPLQFSAIPAEDLTRYGA